MVIWICTRCHVQLRGDAAGICPSCGETEIVPIDSPRGVRLAQAGLAPVATTPARAVPQAAVFALVLSLVGAVGSFLPWVSLGFRSLSGMEGDGKISLGAMVVAGLLGLLGISGRVMSRASGFLVLLCGGIGLAIAVHAGMNMAEIARNSELVRLGAGLHVLGVASFFLGIVGLYAMVGGPRAA